MTRRERLNAIINGEITEELIEECREELKKLDERCAAANEKAKTTKNYLENKVYEERILEVLGEEPMQIEEVRSLVAPELTRQRVTAICTNLVREGRISKVELKVKGKGKRAGYLR